MGVLVGMAFSLLSLLVVAPLVMTLWRPGGTSDIAFPCLALLMLQIVVYPSAKFFRCSVGQNLLPGNPSEYYLQAALFWCFVIVAFLLSLTAAKRKSHALEIHGKQVAFLRHPLTIVGLLFLLSVAGSVLLIVFRGVEVFYDSSLVADSIRESRGLGVLQPLVFSSYTAVSFCSWHAFSRSRVDRTLLFVAIVIAILASVPAIALARRSALLVHALLIATPALVRYRLKMFRLVGPVLVGLVALFDMYSAELRVVYYKTGSIDLEMTQERLGDDPSIRTYGQMEWTAALMSREESGEFQPLMGKTLVSGLLNWLPRWMFPEKGFTGGAYLSSILSGGYSFDDSRPSSGITLGMALEGYLNFRYIGGFVIMLVLGALLGWVAKTVSHRARDAFWVTLWSLIFVFLPLGVFSDDLGGFVNKIVSLSLSVIVLYFMVRTSLQRKANRIVLECFVSK